MAEDWGEEGVVSHSIPCQYVSSWLNLSSWLTEGMKQAIAVQSPLQHSQTCFKWTSIKWSRKSFSFVFCKTDLYLAVDFSVVPTSYLLLSSSLLNDHFV